MSISLSTINNLESSFWHFPDHLPANSAFAGISTNWNSSWVGAYLEGLSIVVLKGDSFVVEAMSTLTTEALSCGFNVDDVVSFMVAITEVRGDAKPLTTL